MMESLASKRARAAKRVKELKGFYNHIKVFVLINGLFFLIKSGWLNAFMPEGVELIPIYFSWVGTNLLIWIAILVVHVLYISRHRWTFLRKWEERKIKEFMEQDQDQSEVQKYK